MSRTLILDTNVLLADPGVLLSFPDDNIVLPETVLAELDKLKTSRVDPDLRFRGREISRILFDLSEQGSLTDGVDLPDGGTLRVATLDEGHEMPEGLSSRNADDRILAVAWGTCRESGQDCEAALVTNDLNMLLKAQTLGVPVQRYGDGLEASFTRRYIVRPFQRYKIPIAILAVALSVFAAVLVLTFWGPGSSNVARQLPAEFKALLSTPQQKALDYLTTLQSNPNDPEALLGMANTYLDQHDRSAQVDPASAITFAQNAVRYFDRYLQQNPSDVDARVDLAVALFYANQTDRAIQEVTSVLASNPNHLKANFNLGVFLWRGRRDFDGAAAQFKKFIDLAKGDPNQALDVQRATAFYNQVQQDKRAGSTATPTGGVQ
jgi:tetratricopeptide (TPR) repeat protein